MKGFKLDLYLSNLIIFRKQMKKKLLSIILALSLFLVAISFLPSKAFADSELTPDEGHDLIALKDGAKAVLSSEMDGSDGGDYYWWGSKSQQLRVFKNGLTISGTTNTEVIRLMSNVTEITIDNLSISVPENSEDPAIYFWNTGENCELTVKGSNSLSTGIAGILCMRSIKIMGDGDLTLGGQIGVSAPVMTLDCSGTIIADGSLNGFRAVDGFTVTANTGKAVSYGNDDTYGAIYSENPAIDSNIIITCSTDYQAAEESMTSEGAFDTNSYSIKIDDNVAKSVLIACPHNITNGTASNANGTILIPESAKLGDLITVTVNPSEGYLLKSLTYNDGVVDHEIIKDETSGNYQFVMPSKTVTVTATFELSHVHNFVKHDEIEPSKKSAGCKEYYECDCGEIYENKEHTVKIDDLSSWKAEGGNGYLAPKGGANLTWLWIILGILFLLIIVYVVVFFIWKKNEELPSALAFLGFLVPSFKAINNSLFKKKEEKAE